jgi:hypothetical protein
VTEKWWDSIPIAAIRRPVYRRIDRWPYLPDDNLVSDMAAVEVVAEMEVSSEVFLGFVWVSCGFRGQGFVDRRELSL